MCAGVTIDCRLAASELRDASPSLSLLLSSSSSSSLFVLAVLLLLLTSALPERCSLVG